MKTESTLLHGDDNIATSRPAFDLQNQQWVESEFSSADLGDGRLNKRIITLVKALSAAPDTSIPQATGSWANAKGAYRFYNNKKVTPDKIISPHWTCTKSRIAQEKIILAIQDTSTLNFTHLSETKGLGSIGSETYLRGIHVHSTMAFTPQRVPLGLIHQLSWVRPPDQYGKKKKRRDLPIDEKESFKWIASLNATERVQQESDGTHLINIGDREADIFDLFLQASDYHCDLIVRAAWNRRVDHPEKYLWDYIEAQPLATSLSVTIPRKKKSPERVAEVELRFAPVTINPPRNRSSSITPLHLWAIHLNEPSPPQKAEPISWLLITTLPVSSVENALKCIAYYTVRFSIEVFHKVLKSGCKIEKYQFKTVDALKRCLAIDSIIAWRIMFLTMLGREVPDLPCTALFEEHEWKALYCFALKTSQPPSSPPSLGEAVRLVAKLGGFLGRKHDGHPGVQILWRGMKVLSVISHAWDAFGPESKTISRTP